MPKKFLLVSEGPTDYCIFKGVADKLSEIKGDQINIQLLSPEYDRTTCSYAAHGFGAIKKWCQSFQRSGPEQLSKLPPRIAAVVARKNWESIVRASGADGLIIQMDTDIADQIGYIGSCHDESISHCKSQILKWLNEDDPHPLLYTALTPQSLETWILATYPRSHSVFNNLSAAFEFEKLTDVEKRLISLGHKAGSGTSKGRLLKQTRYYEEYAAKVASSLQDVRRECQSAESLCLHLSL